MQDNKVNSHYPSIQSFEPALQAERNSNDLQTRILVAAGVVLALAAVGAIVGTAFSFKAMAAIPKGEMLTMGASAGIFLIPGSLVFIGGSIGCFLGAKYHTDHEKEKLQELLGQSSLTSREKIEFFLKYQHKFTGSELYDQFYKHILSGQLRLNEADYTKVNFDAFIALVIQRYNDVRNCRNYSFIPFTLVREVLESTLTSPTIDTINPGARSKILEALGKLVTNEGSRSIPSQYVGYFINCQSLKVTLGNPADLQRLPPKCTTLTLDCTQQLESSLPAGTNFKQITHLTLTGLRDLKQAENLLRLFPNITYVDVTVPNGTTLEPIKSLMDTVDGSSRRSIYLRNLSPDITAEALNSGVNVLECLKEPLERMKVIKGPKI